MEETTRKYGVTAEVSGFAGAAAAPRVSMLIAGNFPSSPITFTYSFALEGGLISRLETSQYDSAPSFKIDPIEFEDKRVFVSGGTKGAGEAIVKRMAGAGAIVATSAPQFR